MNTSEAPRTRDTWHLPLGYTQTRISTNKKFSYTVHFCRTEVNVLCRSSQVPRVRGAFFCPELSSSIATEGTPSRGGCRSQLSCTRTHIPTNKKFSYTVQLCLTELIVLCRSSQLRTATATSGSTFRDYL